MNKKFALIFVLILIGACSSDPPTMISATREHIKPEVVATVFRAGYDITWASALKAMNIYNLKVTNKDGGTIQTDDIKKFDDSYEPIASNINKNPRTPVNYSIEVKITPLEKGTEGNSRTEVSVIKFIERGDSIFDKKQIQSNLIEEQVVLYRIKRVLELERMKFERNRN